MKAIKISVEYRSPIRFAALSIGLLAVLNELVLDMGECLTAYIYSLLAYLVLFLIVLIRRPFSPTNIDLLAIKWGFVILFFFGLAIYPSLWRLRGVL